MINRPGVAGAVPQTPLSLINLLTNSVNHPLWKYFLIHCIFQTIRDRDLEIWGNVHPHHVSHFTCYMSHVTCHVSHVTWHHYSKTVRARDLTFWDNVHHPPFVTCHMSCVTCHTSHVTRHIFLKFFIYFFKIFFWQIVGASRLRIGYQRALSPLVFSLLKNPV